MAEMPSRVSRRFFGINHEQIRPIKAMSKYLTTSRCSVTAGLGVASQLLSGAAGAEGICLGRCVN